MALVINQLVIIVHRSHDSRNLQERGSEQLFIIVAKLLDSLFVFGAIPISIVTKKTFNE